MEQTTNYPGTDRKFMVTTTQEDFLLVDDDFEITVIDPYRRQRRIAKQDCFFDSDGRYYFTLERTLRGTYYAWFKGWYEDDDYDEQTRQFTDGQVLCEVGVKACRCGIPEQSSPTRSLSATDSTCHCRHVVQYQEVTTVSLDGDEYLADTDGKYILTSDGKRIAFKNPTKDKITDMGKVRLNMTGDEFKTLIEGTSPNGEIDTLPEVMAAAQGISDDETIQHDVDERIDVKIEENNEETEVERVSPEELAAFQV